MLWLAKYSQSTKEFSISSQESMYDVLHGRYFEDDHPGSHIYKLAWLQRSVSSQQSQKIVKMDQCCGLCRASEPVVSEEALYVLHWAWLADHWHCWTTRHSLYYPTSFWVAMPFTKTILKCLSTITYISPNNWELCIWPWLCHLWLGSSNLSRASGVVSCTEMSADKYQCRVGVFPV